MPVAEEAANEHILLQNEQQQQNGQMNQEAAENGMVGLLQNEQQPRSQKRMNHSRTGDTYTMHTTVGESLMDVSLMTANITHLKAVIDYGDANKFFWPLIVLISLCLLLQLVVGFLILHLGLKIEDKEDKERAKDINRRVVGLIALITVLNMAIGVFGISTPKT